MPSALAVGLHRSLERAGIPIYGVSIGRELDRATWRVCFAPNATALQQAQAEAIVQAYDVTADSTLRDELADRELAFKALASLARATWEYLPAGKPTWGVFLSRWKAIYLANS